MDYHYIYIISLYIYYIIIYIYIISLYIYISIMIISYIPVTFFGFLPPEKRQPAGPAGCNPGDASRKEPPCGSASRGLFLDPWWLRWLKSMPFFSWKMGGLTWSKHQTWWLSGYKNIYHGRLVGGFKLFYCFPFHIWDVILPIDELIFFKMGYCTTNQIFFWC